MRPAISAGADGRAEDRRSEAPIDRAHLARYTLGDSVLEVEILGLFAGQAPATLAALAGAADPKAWRDAAHTLKGSARAVGATRVAAAAAAAEHLARAEPRQRQAALDAVAAAVDEACGWIAALAAAADSGSVAAA